MTATVTNISMCSSGAHGHAHVERRRVAARAAHVAGAAAAAAARAARPAAPPRPLLPVPARALPQRHAAEGACDNSYFRCLCIVLSAAVTASRVCL